jgi:hypothetical protein
VDEGRPEGRPLPIETDFRDIIPPPYHTAFCHEMSAGRDRGARRNCPLCFARIRPPQPAAFDASKEILIKGKVARLDWKNPHIYLIIETIGENGKPQLIEGEGLAITQALVDGLHREDLKPGTAVVVRANPNRGGPGKTVRVLDVTTPDGEIHPFYAASTRTRTLTPADSLKGSWAPSLPSMNAAWA